MLYEVGSVVVQVIVPEQLSVALGAVTDAPHSPVAFGRLATLGTGAVHLSLSPSGFVC